MATNGVNFTYGDVARRESLLDVLTMISPKETQLFTGLQKSRAENTLHEWITRDLETVGSNAQNEGQDAPADASGNPSRLQNVTQIFAKTAKVSNTELSVNRVGGDRMAEEIRLKLAAMKNDIEYALMRGSIASGGASTGGTNARQLRGVKNWITTNSVNYSGATLTETLLNDIFESVWNQGGNVDAVYTSMKGKRRISSFTSGNTKNIDAEDKRLVNAVDVYEADAAKMVKLFAHRYVTVAGDYGTTATPGFDLIAMQEDTWAVAFLKDREPKTIDLAITGDFKAKEIVTELTLEARAEEANALARVLF